MKDWICQHLSHLKISSNVKCDSSCGVNNVKNGEIKIECQHPKGEDNDKERLKSLMDLKPFYNPITFK